ncbi:hypothetical protein BC831DRAFT_461732 [Entophlyctis helioformis]|nr:hypothetical protein BC831DRAFT_461732 [Entophlyctis helioformis]
MMEPPLQSRSSQPTHPSQATPTLPPLHPLPSLAVQSPSAITTDRFWRSQKISGKVLEAKYLEWDKSDGSCDPYCVVRVDNNAGTESRTHTSYNTPSPFWSEDFVFESVQGFRDLKFVVWNENNGKSTIDRPLGKIVFPKTSVKNEDEQWYMLQNADNELTVTGEVRIRIKHFPPKRRRQVHGFSVRIVSARGLYAKDAQHYPNPYAVFHILPDPDAISTQQTRVQARTVNPSFSETFFFTYNASDITDKELHCSLWDQSTSESDFTGFLGQVAIPLKTVILRQRTERWYSLNPMPSDSTGPGTLERRVRARKRSLTEEEKRNRPRELVKSLHLMDSNASPQGRKAHQFVEAGMTFSACAHCNGVLIGTHLQCSDCSMVCHQKCKDSVVPICGGVGALRLRIRISDTIVLPLEMYKDFVNILQEDDYLVPCILGKVSQDREDAARCMIRLFESNGTVVRFLKACIAQEISQASDAKTLFRANSMASKAVDVFMKHVGLNYLKAALEAPLREIVQSNKSAELDPLKIEKTDKPEKETAKNLAVLTRFNTIVIDSIFASLYKIPTSLKDFFWFLQDTATKKFGSDHTVRYTSISGFIFLRFFAPAVLGPKLFGLDVGPIDGRAGRNLLLVAKTLQNISNLVEFGQKEPYMAPMNPFIQSRIPDMKLFIEAISNKPLLKDPSSTLVHPPPNIALHELFANVPKECILLARACAELHGIFNASLDKMLAADPSSITVQKLAAELAKIEESRKACEQSLGDDVDARLLPWFYDEDVSDAIQEVIGDSGTESEGQSDGAANDTAREDDDERKIIRMLTRCSSTSIRTSLGSFRHSTDLRESILRGTVKGEPNVPFASIVPVQGSTGPSLAVPTGAGGSFRDRPSQHLAAPDRLAMRSSSAGDDLHDIALEDAAVAARSVERVDDRSLQRVRQTEGPRIGRAGSDASITGGGAGSTAGSDKGKSKRESITSRVASSFGYLNKLLFDGSPAEGGSGAEGVNGQDKASPGQGPDRTGSPSFRRRGRRESQSNIASAASGKVGSPSASTPLVASINPSVTIGPLQQTEEVDEAGRLSSVATSVDQQGPASLQLVGSFVSGESSLAASLLSSPAFEGSWLDNVCECDAFDAVQPSVQSDQRAVHRENSRTAGTPNVPQATTAPATNASAEVLCTKCGKRKVAQPMAVLRRENSKAAAGSPSVGSPLAGADVMSTTTGSAPFPGSTAASAAANAKFMRGQRPRRTRDGSDSSSMGNPGIGTPTGGTPNGAPQGRSRSATVTKREQILAGNLCGRCGLELQDAMFEADGKRYHPACLTCAICKVALTTSLIPLDGDVVCRECFLRREGLVCGVCNELIYAEYLTVNGRQFHVSCRKCDQCGQGLTGKEHFTLGDQVFCIDHRDAIITCQVCHQRIDGEVLIAGQPQRFYHLNHFCCGGCGKDLSATVFYEMDGRPWCQPCFLDHGEKSPVQSTEMLAG